MNSNIANMKQAVFEMFGVGSGIEIEVTAKEERLPSDAQPVVEAAPAAAMTVVPTIRAATMSYFAAGTVFEGTLRCDGDVEIAGEVSGEVKATGAVSMYAPMNGNISAGSLTLTGCTLTGDVAVASTLTVSENASIQGNVSAKDIHCSGVIEGDLDLTGNIMLERTAKVRGNISAGSFTVEKGAVIHGSLDVKSK